MQFTGKAASGVFCPTKTVLLALLKKLHDRQLV